MLQSPHKNKVPAGSGLLVGPWQQGEGRDLEAQCSLLTPWSPGGLEGGEGIRVAEAPLGPRATSPTWPHFQVLPSHCAWCFSAPTPFCTQLIVQ